MKKLVYSVLLLLLSFFLQAKETKVDPKKAQSTKRKPTSNCDIKDLAAHFFSQTDAAAEPLSNLKTQKL